jgi:CubicO group peptidase (beta-lactamase class C family)
MLKDYLGSREPCFSKSSANTTPEMKLIACFGIYFFLGATALLPVWAGEAAKAGDFDASYCPAEGDPALTNELVAIRNRRQVPALAAALVTSKGVVRCGVAGVRKAGTRIPATLDDQWHLGSDGKAMTATLIGKLVEQGRLKWDSTVGEIFPDLAPQMDGEARSITVLQLLSHRSGLKPNPSLRQYGGKEGAVERLRVLKDEFAHPPPHKPGSQFQYSNLGYSIAGAIAEKITGKTWEQAMKDEVFGPLGMKSVGFGGTGTPGKVDQPWPHFQNGRPVAQNGPEEDNPPVLSPAGRVHCTIQDWAKFIADQLRGERGETALLKPATYRKLHTAAFGGDYALGWLVLKRTWGGGTVLQHLGDNTMNCANVWMAPQRDFALLACVNQSGKTAFDATDDAVGALIQLQEKAPHRE